MSLANASGNLETARQEFNDYAYVVSHDLSAPVRAMKQFSLLLQEEQTKGAGEDAALYLSLIIDSADKLQNMMDGLLAFSRLHTRQQQHISVNITKIFQQVIADLDAQIKSRGAVIEYDNLPELNGDEHHLSTLFYNLLDNAIKFTPAGAQPHIKISAIHEDNTYHFMVQDNGIGIPPKFHERIFMIFQRLHTDAEYPGVGIGLALAKKIVEQHGGRIWIEAAHPGSIIHFTIFG